MSQDHATPPDPALPPGALGFPLLCIGCRYDLFATAREGACPECGRAVTDSLEPSRLWFVNPRWLRFNLGAQALVLGGVAWTIGAPLFAAIVLGLFDLLDVRLRLDPDVYEWGFIVLIEPGLLATFLGLLLSAVPERDVVRRRRHPVLRAGLALSVLVLTVLGAGMFIATYIFRLHEDILYYEHRGGPLLDWLGEFIFAATYVGIVLTAQLAALFHLMLLASLARRMQTRWLAHMDNIATIAMGLSIAGTVVFSLGVAVLRSTGQFGLQLEYWLEATVFGTVVHAAVVVYTLGSMFVLAPGLAVLGAIHLVAHAFDASRVMRAQAQMKKEHWELVKAQGHMSIIEANPTNLEASVPQPLSHYASNNDT